MLVTIHPDNNILFYKGTARQGDSWRSAQPSLLDEERYKNELLSGICRLSVRRT